MITQIIKNKCYIKKLSYLGLHATELLENTESNYSIAVYNIKKIYRQKPVNHKAYTTNALILLLTLTIRCTCMKVMAMKYTFQDYLNLTDERQNRQSIMTVGHRRYSMVM